MGSLTVCIVDVSGSRRREAQLPDDVPLQRLLLLLVERMNLPLNSPDGQLMSYKLHHRKTGKQLLETQTLPEAGVIDGDELRLQPEIIAGAAVAERFTRFHQITWWEQERLSRAKVLVVGAGALGNEVLKNLTLLGVGQLVVVDFDTVETSNLSRSVLFREGDEGKLKAQVAEKAIRAMAPGARVKALSGSLQSVLGLGYIRWADVVVGAVDNREARVFINSACAKVGRPWFDAGIEVLNGIVRGFHAPESACYECTMSQADWDELERRRSCSLLARTALDHGGVPTTPTTASILGGIQAQEVVKFLHNKEPLVGRGYFFEGLHHNSYAIAYDQHPDCPWHEDLSEVCCRNDWDQSTTIGEVRAAAELRLGSLDGLDLSRELLSHLHCQSCDSRVDYWRPLVEVTESEAVCSQCQSPTSPHFLASIPLSDEFMAKTVGELGLPAYDILWARSGEQYLGMQVGQPDCLPG